MSQGGYKIYNPDGIYFITFAVVQWIDVFTRSVYADTVVESLKYCQENKGLKLYAWCIMSNHVHLICKANENNLSDVLRDFKTFTSKRILLCIESNERESRRKWMLWLFRSEGKKNSRNSKYQFWRQDNHPIELLPDQNSFAIQKLDYLHNNPVEANIVDNPEDYIYSSARNYAGKMGLIDVIILE